MINKGEGKDVVLLLFAANILPIGLLILTGWFAYLENGYWGWPFAFALMTARGIKTSEEMREEKRKADIQRAEDIRKYGKIMDN